MIENFEIRYNVPIVEEGELDEYIEKIRVEPVLTPEDEHELTVRYGENGDEEALAQIVGSNLRFVISVARQYRNQGCSMEELINAGNQGLVKSANKWDPDRGIKFIAFAVWWARQYILKAIKDKIDETKNAEQRT